MIELDYGKAPLAIENDGRTVRARFEPGHRLKHGNRVYELVELHYHAPSEHTIDGESAAAELHFVHRAEDGLLAVVGVLLEVGGTTSRGLESFVHHAPTEVCENRPVDGVELDLRAILPTELAYYAYDGSLTTPPVTEGVRWFLLQHTVPIRPEDLERLEAVHRGNNRPVQPLNARWILRAGERRGGDGF